MDENQKDIIIEYNKQKELAEKKLEELEKNNKVKYWYILASVFLLSI